MWKNVIVTPIDPCYGLSKSEIFSTLDRRRHGLCTRGSLFPAACILKNWYGHGIKGDEVDADTHSNPITIWRLEVRQIIPGVQ
ncbi:hypothetical protein MPTK1_3g22330 [Marchantia polymorpha subsp. ruderalis]|uniref:Uncharacterized protein n=2 Tax=Marchantia polymorpha TaxID=3197 RepID=A0AAF6B3J1_MARPO|nr:hypothetical protein MARPO_0024s0011 [Marchantia polymorpha]BBN06575.1 hypothetical protein Mp_3g22330 [Marchantia polymorpha subsp. ruderalis]|eukprot:PTQ43475.1 hypothetical protein MARPO_0024s0011 [Marchantia polymorpha]